jgi:hypothetical protein
MGFKSPDQTTWERLRRLFDLSNPVMKCILNVVSGAALLAAASWGSYNIFREPDPPPTPIVVIVKPDPIPVPVPAPRPRPRCHFLAFSWRC